MTRKHYIQFVDLIAWNDLDDAVVSDMCSIFKNDNGRFCKQTFYNAIVEKRKEMPWASK